ncbi:MAG: VWA domain-containing protein [Chthonomonadales bacterium]
MNAHSEITLWTERWYWLPVFLAASVGLHIWITLEYRSFDIRIPVPHPAAIEVSLEPAVSPKLPPAEVKPSPPKPPPAPMPIGAVVPLPVRPPVQAAAEPPPPDTPAQQSAPSTPEGLAAEALPRLSHPQQVASASRPVPPASRPAAPAGGEVRMKDFPPVLRDEAPPIGVPTGVAGAGVPRLRARTRPEPLRMAGGAPAPADVLGGSGGARGPELPPEDLFYGGLGAGALHAPRLPSTRGGGGGRRILSVDNPLAGETVREERPGIGPGLRGGEGAGIGGGVGYLRGPGIGARKGIVNGIAALRAKEGLGIGAGRGGAIGSRSPRGGAGVGSELPGIGTGIGLGAGEAAGRGAAAGLRGKIIGLPAGHITGLLGAGGSVQSQGRGGVFGVAPQGAEAAVHIVYLLDTSLSMRDGGKLSKAQQALKMALAELKPGDTFNIITFASVVQPFSVTMVPADPANISRAMLWVDSVALGDGTNLSGALAAALAQKTATHIYVLSDGEPTDGITDPGLLREAVFRMNAGHAKIQALALGLGDHFKGMEILKALAEDSGGTFAYVNLAQ